MVVSVLIVLSLANHLCLLPTVVIHGIWFYDKEDCQRIAQRMKSLTQQEQILAQSQGGWLSPGGGGVRGGGGGIGIGENSSSEPKEIGGSSVLCGNPNLIKPIPVKPNTQNSEGPEPKPLSLATLFGSQHQCHQSRLAPTVAAPTSTGKLPRPPVARTLTYDDAVASDKSVSSAGGNVSLIGGSDGGVRPATGDHISNAGAKSPTAATDQLLNDLQHCPAIAKLMQSQRGVGSVGGVLQTLSESPENRLCDNGVPLEHHHHHHLYHHHHQQHHHHHQLQQLQHDPIKRLLQPQPAPPLATSFSFAAAHCCSNPPPPQQSSQLSSQHVMGDSVSCSHLRAQQSHQMFLTLSKSQTEEQHTSQAASTTLGAGLPSQLQSVVSPHELLQKLRLVQQEQSLTSHDPPRHYPGLAPRFLRPTQIESANSSSCTTPATATAGQKAALQFQVISPQRIPATVAPTLLLSPRVFTQTQKSGSGLSAVAQESCPAPSALPIPSLQKEVGVLSRSQLQATLLHLIQTDSSFLDTIYDAYVSRFTNGSSSKY
ncbi:mRNA-decapping enzyme 1B [Xenentodon cancila]